MNLSGVFKDLRLVFFPEKPEETQLKSPSAIFADELSYTPWDVMDLEETECILKDDTIYSCIQRVREHLNPEECDLSDKSKRVIEFYKNHFDIAIDQNKELSKEQSSLSKKVFNKSLCKLIEKNWHPMMAKSFYHLLFIADEDEKIKAVQKWSLAYFQGCKYLSKGKGERNFLTFLSEPMAKYAKKTTSSLTTYSHQLAHQVSQSLISESESLIIQSEEDPILFQENLERARLKAEEQGVSSLSASEAKYLKFLKEMGSNVVYGNPEIEKNAGYLSKCIWLGFSLQLVKHPILNNQWSEELFRQKFKPKNTQVPIFNLPTLLIEKIFTELSVSEIGTCAKSCKKLWEVSKRESLWKSVYHVQHPESDRDITHNYLTSLKSTYLDWAKGSKIFPPNVKNSKFSYQYFDCRNNPKIKWIFAKDRCYQYDGQKVEVFDLILGKSFQLSPQEGEKRTLEWGAINRVLTVVKPSDEVITYTLWNTETQKCMKKTDYALKSTKVIFKNADYFVTLTEGGEVKFWDLKTGEVFALEHRFVFTDFELRDTLISNRNLIHFSEDYCWIRTQHLDVVIFNIKTMKKMVLSEKVLFEDQLHLIDNRLCQCSNSNKMVKIWDLDTGKCLHQLPQKGELEGIKTKYKSPDLGILLSAFSRNTLKFWRIETGEILLILDHGEPVLWYDAMDNFILTGSSKTTRVWNATSGECLYELDQKFSWDDSERKIVANLLFINEASGQLNIWNIETGKHHFSINTPRNQDQFKGWFEVSGNFLFFASKPATNGVIIYDIVERRFENALEIHEGKEHQFFLHGNSLVVHSFGSEDQLICVEIFDFREILPNNN